MWNTPLRAVRGEFSAAASASPRGMRRAGPMNRCSSIARSIDRIGSVGVTLILTAAGLLQGARAIRRRRRRPAGRRRALRYRRAPVRRRRAGRTVVAGKIVGGERRRPRRELRGRRRVRSTSIVPAGDRAADEADDQLVDCAAACRRCTGRAGHVADGGIVRDGFADGGHGRK